MKGKITLEGMEFYCCHGCLEEEQRLPNLFVVDFEGDLDVSDAVRSDLLQDTVDYSLIYNIIERRMQTPCALLEHLCGSIVGDIAEQVPELERFSVRVSKRRPPLGGRAAWARVQIEHKR